MPRVARAKDDYGIYYITQLGSLERDLFQNENDRNKFLSILLASKEQNGFKLYAYCLTRPNEYHLIINAFGSDISKVMKGINITYAMYVSHPGNIFKDRYKSVLINDKKVLLDLLAKIHSEGQKTNSSYNSYCAYNSMDLTDSKLIDSEDLKLLNTKENCFNNNTDCKNCIRTMDDAYRKLEEISICKGMSIEELTSDKAIRNELIKKFRRDSILSLKELGEIFGGLSESSICKILK